MAGGYVVLCGNIGGVYARGSIIPEGAFTDERIAHWMTREVVRKANEDDIAAVNGPTLATVTAKNAAERVAEIEATELRLANLKSTHEVMLAAETARISEAEAAAVPPVPDTSVDEEVEAAASSGTRIGRR